MLAAAERLRRREEFSATVRAGRRAVRGALVIHLRTPDPTLVDHPPTRAGFVVSRSVGNAVTRNRVRRRLRHIVRLLLADLPAGTELVVRALPDAATRTYRQLEADLRQALVAAGRSRSRS